jgi:hypothetical protein
MDKESVGETLTEKIQKHFCGGYNIIWGDWLNWCMLDYDIICIMKDYSGYSSWSNDPIKQRDLCYQNFNNKFNLPAWSVQREKF